MNNESLNEFYSLEEKTQIGVQLTAQLSHCFYSFLKYKANKIFEESNSFLRVVNKKPQIGKSYDLTLININTNDIYYIEVKLSQNENSWQGSTSSTSKVDLFLLVNFKIDRNKKLNLGESLFTGIFASLIDMNNKNWSGTAKENNHRTKFDFRLDEWNIEDITEYSLIKGSFIKKKSIAHLQLEKVFQD